MRIRWSGFRPMYDFWGNEMKRYYQLETLASATDRLLNTSDRFIVPSVQAVLGPAPITTLSFELFQEGRFQLIFRLQAANAKRKTATFAFVVAKKHEDFSAVAQAEHRNLQVLFERAPAHVVKPYRGGTIYLPDRHQRLEHGREVYAYLTQWLNGFHELGVNRNLQFFMNVPRPHTFTIAQTEAMKGRMIEIVVRTYAPGKREAMDMPQVASGDFVVTAPSKDLPKLKLIACRRIQRHLTPAKLIHNLISTSWDWNGLKFRLMPADPEILVDAVMAAVGPELTRAWFSAYDGAVARGTVRESDVLSREDLRGLGVLERA